MVEEPVCYVEAKDIDDLIKIMSERRTLGMTPGWCPVENKQRENEIDIEPFN